MHKSHKARDREKSRVRTVEADHLPSQFTGESAKKTKTTNKMKKERQLSHKWLVGEKWQSLCFPLFSCLPAWEEGIRSIYSSKVHTD